MRETLVVMADGDAGEGVRVLACDSLWPMPYTVASEPEANTSDTSEKPTECTLDCRGRISAGVDSTN